MASCGEKQETFSPTEARLSKLGLDYGLYTAQHRGSPPSKVEDLRDFVENAVVHEQLTALGVNTAAELFISPRDGKPYKMVALRRLPSPVAGKQPPVVLYEEVGLNGRRFVAYLGGGVQEVDAEKFKTLVTKPK